MKTLLMAALVVLAMASPAWATEYPIHFAWDANMETDLAGYRLYQSDVSGQYQYGDEYAIATIDPPETAISSAIVADHTYYWVLTAYDEAGNESDPSNEVSYTLVIPDTEPPAAPGGFNITVNITFNLTAPQIAIK